MNFYVFQFSSEIICSYTRTWDFKSNLSFWNNGNYILTIIIINETRLHSSNFVQFALKSTLCKFINYWKLFFCLILLKICIKQAEISIAGPLLEGRAIGQNVSLVIFIGCQFDPFCPLVWHQISPFDFPQTWFHSFFRN